MHLAEEPRIFLEKDFDRPYHAEMTLIPKALALDLVNYLAGVSCFLYEVTDEECEAGLPQKLADQHQKKMEALERMVCDHLCGAPGSPTAEHTLRAMAMIYEARALTEPTTV